jgi:hypothetical protein
MPLIYYLHNARNLGVSGMRDVGIQKRKYSQSAAYLIFSFSAPSLQIFEISINATVAPTIWLG